MSEHAFSAEVSLTLTLRNRVLKLSHVGPDFFILQDASEEFPNGVGDLTIRIDDHTETTSVFVERLSNIELGRFTYLPVGESAERAATAARS